MASWEFSATGPVEALIRIPDGSITVDAAAGEDITVQIGGGGGWWGNDPLSQIRVEYEDGRLLVADQGRFGLLRSRSFQFDVAVRLPAGSSCKIDTAAADVRCNGEFGALKARTASGDVTAGQVLGWAEAQTASGDVRVGSAGQVRARTVSGDIEVGAVGGDATCQSVSGDVEIGRAMAGRIEAKTTSGDITVGMAPGICLRLDLATLSGRAGSELGEPENGGDIAATVRCYSVSGNVLVRRADEAPGPSVRPERI